MKRLGCCVDTPRDGIIGEDDTSSAMYPTTHLSIYFLVGCSVQEEKYHPKGRTQ